MGVSGCTAPLSRKSVSVLQPVNVPECALISTTTIRDKNHPFVICLLANFVLEFGVLVFQTLSRHAAYHNREHFQVFWRVR